MWFKLSFRVDDTLHRDYALQMKTFRAVFSDIWCHFIMFYKVVLTFESVDEILTCDHSNESY